MMAKMATLSAGGNSILHANLIWLRIQLRSAITGFACYELHTHPRQARVAKLEGTLLPIPW